MGRSFAPYCVDLLASHYNSVPFHQALKMSLFSTKIKNSVCNFACDTKTEMEHQDATKCFRAGTNFQAIQSRMSLIDPFNDAHKLFEKEKRSKTDNFGFTITDKDKQLSLPTAQLKLKRGLRAEECLIPYNVYRSEFVPLPLERAFKLGNF